MRRQKEQHLLRLPPEWHKEVRRCISRASDEAFNLTTNIFGVYVKEELDARLRKRAEREITTKLTTIMSNTIKIVPKMQEEVESQRFEAFSAKEKFYLVTDQMRPFIEDIPENVNVIDACLQACEEIKNFRFEFSYLRNTKYEDYVESLGKLLDEITKANRIDLAYNLLFKEFKDTQDAYILLQAIFQKLLKHYNFLEQERRDIKKKQIDRYLEIYEEMSGHFEKYVALIVGLIMIMLTGSVPKYYDLKKRRLHRNISFLEKYKYETMVSGFNRSVRNAIVHKSYKVDLVNESVSFLDADKEFKMSFTDLRNATRELGANLLTVAHIFVLTFCSLMQQFKEFLDKLE